MFEPTGHIGRDPLFITFVAVSAIDRPARPPAEAVPSVGVAARDIHDPTPDICLPPHDQTCPCHPESTRHGTTLNVIAHTHGLLAHGARLPWGAWSHWRRNPRRYGWVKWPLSSVA